MESLHRISEERQEEWSLVIDEVNKAREAVEQPDTEEALRHQVDGSVKQRHTYHPRGQGKDHE